MDSINVNFLIGIVDFILQELAFGGNEVKDTWDLCINFLTWFEFLLSQYKNIKDKIRAFCVFLENPFLIPHYPLGLNQFSELSTYHLMHLYVFCEIVNINNAYYWFISFSALYK